MGAICSMDHEAFKQFAEHIGRPEEPYRESFREVWHEMTERKRGMNHSDAAALSLLMEWYELAQQGWDQERSPFEIIESYRRPRSWVILFERTHRTRA